MYAGRRRIGGGTDAHPAASPATTVVVVVAAAAVVVRIVVGAGRVGAARIAQPGVGAGRKVGVSLIGTGIVAQIGDVVATVEAVMRLTGMQTRPDRLI